MPVTHGVTGSSPVRTAINIENQCFTKQAPDFTPKNVKSGVFNIYYMSWYIRKAVKAGPVRFNLSKSGIGASIGITGFRIGIKPNGRSYIHAGRYGLYYREEFGNNKTSTNKFDSTPDNGSADNTTFYNTAGSEELKSDYKKDVVEALTKSYKAFRYDYLTGLVALIIIIILFFNKNSFYNPYDYPLDTKGVYTFYLLNIIIAAIGIITFIFVAKWETKRRQVNLVYEFENNNFEYYKEIISAFNKIAQSKKIWSLISSEYLLSDYQSKINAGARNLVDRGSASSGTGKLPWVNTNINIPLIKANGKSLYFVPDGILVYDSKGVAYVDYQNLKISYDTTHFADEYPPSDANIIYTTWQYTNKGGGPDRRFKNNKEIPVCKYGELKIEIGNKLLLYIMTSLEDAPKEFQETMNKIQTNILNKMH